MIATAPTTGLASAIYEGWVRHRRFSPRSHAFTFPLAMLYLDLAETDDVFSMSRLWSDRRAAPLRFARSDYLGPTDVPLDEAVRERVRAATGRRPDGPVRMLTHLRHVGYVFNPVTFYYCFEDECVRTIVAEITNTPWKQRHAYVLDANDVERRARRFRFQKSFHVSPFMPMDMAYDWGFSEPGERLAVHMNLAREGAKVFDATLRMTRCEITPAAVRRMIVRYPAMTARVIGRIHFEALRLWMKGVPVHPHPDASRTRPEVNDA